MFPSPPLTLAIGPQRPGIGSWEWLGADLGEELIRHYRVAPFADTIPSCDVVILIKELPPGSLEEAADRRIPVIYCPVDRYGSGAEIDREGLRLRLCDRIVLHCEELRKYFQSYTRVSVLEHHLRFVPETIPQRKCKSHPEILWVGHQSHMPLLVNYVNHHPLPGRLTVLTDWEEAGIEERRPAEFHFDSPLPVRLLRWSRARHLQAVCEADLALDIKGPDFRQRHKPSAKAFDFLASNLPLAINADSSPARHLKRLGFKMASPEDPKHWLSEEYRQETERFGAWLRETYSRPQLGNQWRRLIEETAEKPLTLSGDRNR